MALSCKNQCGSGELGRSRWGPPGCCCECWCNAILFSSSPRKMTSPFPFVGQVLRDPESLVRNLLLLLALDRVPYSPRSLQTRMYWRMTLYSWSSALCLPHAGITSISISQTQFQIPFLIFKIFLFLIMYMCVCMCGFVSVSIKPCPVTHPSPFSAAYTPMGVEPSAAAWVTHQPRCYPLSSAAT